MPIVGPLYKRHAPKGVWQVVTIKVEPSHVDDYLTGPNKNGAERLAWAKAPGTIDCYG
jgi:hypothetical protein